MKTYLIYSHHEQSRSTNLERLLAIIPDLEIVDAIYPSKQKVPFVQKAQSLSKDRTGKALLVGEIGCLLSHRKVWQNILATAQNEEEHCLVLESDSVINNPTLLTEFFTNSSLLQNKDFFFFGAWDGNMQLFRSSKKSIANHYTIGQPFIKTIYCTYGYSINKKAARLLLKRTGHFNYPVDQFKRFIKQDELKLGGITPELISSNSNQSNIRAERKFKIPNLIFLYVLSIKNYLICFFK